MLVWVTVTLGVGLAVGLMVGVLLQVLLGDFVGDALGVDVGLEVGVAVGGRSQFDAKSDQIKTFNPPVPIQVLGKDPKVLVSEVFAPAAALSSK